MLIGWRSQLRLLALFGLDAFQGDLLLLGGRDVRDYDIGCHVTLGPGRTMIVKQMLLLGEAVPILMLMVIL